MYIVFSNPKVYKVKIHTQKLHDPRMVTHIGGECPQFHPQISTLHNVITSQLSTFSNH